MKIRTSRLRSNRHGYSVVKFIILTLVIFLSARFVQSLLLTDEQIAVISEARYTNKLKATQLKKEKAMLDEIYNPNEHQFSEEVRALTIQWISARAFAWIGCHLLSHERCYGIDFNHCQQVAVQHFHFCWKENNPQELDAEVAFRVTEIKNNCKAGNNNKDLYYCGLDTTSLAPALKEQYEKEDAYAILDCARKKFYEESTLR